MILLVDGDSLIFASCYKSKSDDGEKFYTDIEDAVAKFDEQFMSIVNHLEDIYTIDEVRVFNGSKGNFRKQITKNYKANRVNIEIPPLLMLVEMMTSFWAFPSISAMATSVGTRPSSRPEKSART